jgi:hypothetical protein
VRLWWDETPVDVFFDYAPVHGRAAAHARPVPFDGVDIPVLAPLELVVFKVIGDRSQDWVDIEAAIAAGTVDTEAVRSGLDELLEAGDPRRARLDEVERRASA